MRRIILLLMSVVVMFECNQTPSNYESVITPIFSINRDKSNVRDGDSLVIDSINITLDINSSTFNYQFRWKIDDGKWETWIEVDDEKYLEILSDKLEPGDHSVVIEVRTGVESEAADSVISFFVAEIPEISEESSLPAEYESGMNCTLWVAAEGTAPLNFTWFKDGKQIDDQKNDTLVLTDITVDENGEYVCKVKNTWGEVESNEMTIRIVDNFTVTYKGNGQTGGEVPVDDKVYLTGDTVYVLENSGELKKTDYSFYGWNTETDGEGDYFPVDTFFIMGTDNVTLNAQWEKNKPTWSVTYNGNGNTDGIVPEDENEYFAGDMVVILSSEEELVRTGYNFTGWNTEEDGSGTKYVHGDTITVDEADIELFAEWKIISYSVTFDSRGGSSIDDQTVNYGEKVDEPTPPEKENDVFIGWSPDTNSLLEWDFEADTVTGNMTLYAKWSKPGEVVAVKILASENGDIQYQGTSVADDSLRVNVGEALSLSAVPSDNYHFGFWQTVSGDVDWSDSLVDETAFSLTKRSEITAVFIRDSSTLNVVPSSHGTVQYQGAALPGDSLRIPAGESVAITAVSTADYHFDCWQTISGDVIWSDSLAAVTTVTFSGQSEIKAIFVHDSATLKIRSSAGGSVLYQSATLPGDTLRKPVGTDVELVAVSSEMYHFVRWKTVSGDVDFSDDLTSSTTVTLKRGSEITAVFHRDSLTLEVLPPVNGKIHFKGEEISGDTLRKPTGETLSLTAIPSVNYHFVRWEKVSGALSWSDSLNATNNVVLTSRSEITAVFERDSLTLHFEIDGAGSISYHGKVLTVDSIRLPSNARDSLTCIPENDGWIVTKWETLQGFPTVFSSNSDEDEYKFMLTGNATVSVVLQRQFNLTVRNSGDGYTDPAGTMQVLKDEVIPITAQKELHTTFDRWMITAGDATIADPDNPSTTVILTEADATIEAAFNYKDTLWIPVTFYDFHSDTSNPEFECQHGAGLRTDMVAEELDVDGKPVIGSDPYLSQYIKYWFRSWSDTARGDSTMPVYECKYLCGSEYTASMDFKEIISVDHDTAFKNVVIEDSLPFVRVLDREDVPAGTYEYSNQEFFPLDDRGFGQEGRLHNFSYTMELHWNFTYRSGLMLEFNGDDDVWAFVDKQLRMDLGGIHNAWGGEIDLDDIHDLKEGQVYPLDFFYCERHTDNSRIRITTNIFRKAVAD